MKRERIPLFGFLLLFVIAACSRDSANAKNDRSPQNIGISAHVARAPDVIRRDGNGLLGSASEYLREHAHDPVDWQPWNAETLARAVAEDKPIFLSIGYSACHFCHVMHDEVFSKDDVAQMLNAHYVSIKVDREERPDIDATYIAALEHLSGSAGWPATLFLTPSLDPYFGATYVQHDRFLELGAQAADLYAQRDAGDFSVVDIQKLLTDTPPDKGTALTSDEIRAFAASATGDMDPIRGGMTGRTKFPMVPRLEFLLHATRKWNLPELTKMLRTTLDAMMSGALRDPISGGFHRYTTDPDWTTPHYEIMLYDDAQLASLYFEAAAVMQEPRYLVVARATLDFLASDMKVASGAFAASFDADTKGEEGAAWRWSKSEIDAVAGVDAAIVEAVLDVKDLKVAPARRKTFAEIATALHLKEKDVTDAWNRARPLLRAARAGVAKRDDKVVAAWNGLAIAAFSRGFLVTGDAHYRDIAVAAADATWRDLHDSKGALTRTPGGAPAFAIDYADLAWGYLSLFEATNDPSSLARTEMLLRDASPLEAHDGGYYDGRSDLAHSISLDDGVEPSPTAAMLHVLELRDVIGTADAWHMPAVRAFSKYGNALRERSLGAAAWLDDALLDGGPMYDVVIAGDSAALTSVYGQLDPTWSIATHVPAAGADAPFRAALPSLANKAAVNGNARAYVCENGTCKAPTSDPIQLRAQLLTGRIR